MTPRTNDTTKLSIALWVNTLMLSTKYECNTRKCSKVMANSFFNGFQLLPCFREDPIRRDCEIFTQTNFVQLFKMIPWWSVPIYEVNTSRCPTVMANPFFNGLRLSPCFREDPIERNWEIVTQTNFVQLFEIIPWCSVPSMKLTQESAQ